MQKIVFISAALISLSFLTLSCGSSKHGGKNRVAGTWQAQPIVIDGANMDWPSPYPSYDADAMVGYATSNDKDNLYITMETADEYTQMKILKAGMMVWIDTSGGRNMTMGIHYPMPADDTNPLEIEAHHEGERPSNKQADLSKSMIASKVKKGVKDATQLSLEGFGKCSGGLMVGQKNECGITVKLGMDEYGELIWEAAIPFKAIYGKEQITAKEAGRPISVCIAVKGFKKPSTSNGGDQSTAMSSDGRMNATGMNGNRMGGAGMGGGRGGRGGGGRGGNTANPREKLFESSRTWKQFTIAYQ